MDREDFGAAEDVEVIARLVDLAGRDVVEVGCGSGRIARALVARGARVIGVEPDPTQAARNRAAPALPGLTFVEAPGEALPLADATVDGVLFTFSLHHIAPAAMAPALAEARRVTRAGGFLYVVEPTMVGSYAALTRPFNDESEVYALALAALAREAAPYFRSAREVHYHNLAEYPDFEAFVAEKLGASYNDHRREAVDTPEVRALFAAGRSGDVFRFDHHLRVNYYQGLLGRARETP